MHHYWKSGVCTKCGVNYRYPTSGPCRGAFMSPVQVRALKRLLKAFQEWPYFHVDSKGAYNLSEALKRTRRNRKVLRAVIDAFPQFEEE